MFSNGSVDKMEDRVPEVNHPMEENPRVKQISKKERYAFDADGKPFSALKQYQYRDGLFEALVDRFYKDQENLLLEKVNKELKQNMNIPVKTGPTAIYENKDDEELSKELMEAYSTGNTEQRSKYNKYFISA